MGWRFWLQWVFASTVGWSSGAFLGYFLLSSWPLLWATFFGGLGAAVGIMQWLVLRQRIHRAGWWVLASVAAGIVGLIVGWPLGFSLRAALGDAIFYAVTWPTHFAIVGGVGGVIQWFLLRRQVYQASIWVLASSLGWAAFGLSLGTVNTIVGAMLGGLFEAIDFVLDFVVGGLLAGAITGAAMVWLLRHPFPEAQKT